MPTVVESIEAESFETAVMAEAASASITTTLYDLVAAVQAAVGPQDGLVVPSVLHMLRSGHATWHGDGVGNIN